MIKKYDNNYIDLSKVCAVTKIMRTSSDKYCSTVKFTVCVAGITIDFIDNQKDKERLSALRERIVKDWMEVKNDKRRSTKKS